MVTVLASMQILSGERTSYSTVEMGRGSLKRKGLHLNDRFDQVLVDGDKFCSVFIVN